MIIFKVLTHRRHAVTPLSRHAVTSPRHVTPSPTKEFIKFNDANERHCRAGSNKLLYRVKLGQSLPE